MKYKELGKTGLKVSVSGFGSYRVDVNIDQHKEALAYALRNGINLIDSSSNYSDGGSEELIGETIKDLGGEIKREDLVIVTKGGYLQGTVLKEAQMMGEGHSSLKEAVKCSPDLWHCIHPEFLNVQITKSLKKLNTEYIDVYLLHNPEYFLTYSVPGNSQVYEEYYDRIKNAFLFLEEEVRSGRIKYYGVSSNTFGHSADAFNFTSLEKLCQIAEGISEDNKFAVIQFPLNIIEKGAAVNKNQQSGSHTLLEYAAMKELGTLVNRPLNSIVNNKIFRLADFQSTEDRNKLEIDELIEQVKNQESNLILSYVNEAVNGRGERKALIDCLSLSRIIKENYDKFESPNNFNEIRSYYLIPRANYAVNELLKIHGEQGDMVNKLREYALTTNILLDSIFSELARNKNETNKKFHTEINQYLDKELHEKPLSQKALLAVNSLKEVSASLVGMRRKYYVDDVLETIKLPQMKNAEEFWSSA